MHNTKRRPTMSTQKSYEEINERIRKGQAVVLTAEEVSQMAQEQGVAAVARKVDVVTTGTFGPMCSSGAFLNFGHSEPPIRMKRVWLNDVPAYAGVAAVDAYIGATEVSDNDEHYGGAHVIEDLIAGKKVHLRATSPGTDCYPRRSIDTWISKDDLNECFLFNPRNAYQNYGAATNTSERILYTYMGMLLPRCGNVTYSTAGELSPLLNDPYLRTIGLGTRIFLGGTEGYIAWNGTQHNPSRPRNSCGIPTGGAATLSLVGDLKAMSPEFIRAAVFEKYGISLSVGVGIPIPVLDEDVARAVSVTNADIETSLFDYSVPSRNRPSLGVYNYEQLRSGSITFKGRTLRTAPMSSLPKARQIAGRLKEWITAGCFEVSRPVAPLPETAKLNSLEIRKEGE
nr:homocysteine biosynthesis protein [uncultured Anaeromusa sp.]